MKLINFKSQPKISPLAPEWNWFMCEAYLQNIDWNEVSKIILEKEKSIVENTVFINDGYTGLGSNSLTSRYHHFNFLKWNSSEIKKIKDSVTFYHDCFIDKINVKRPQKLWIQCWANVLRKDEFMKPHLHSVTPHCYLGGHITVQCDNTETVYINPINQLNEPQEYRSQNEVGKLTLFQNNIPHYTTKHMSDSERISIAFDITTEEPTTDNMLPF